MHDDDYDELRATLALLRLAWPQLVTMFGFLFAVLLRYPTWFVVLSVLVVSVSISQVAMNVARNPARRFDFAVIDGLLIGSGWSASLLSMAWLHIERTLHLEPGALLCLTIQTTLASTPNRVSGSIVMQWMSCSGALLTMLIWAFSGRYLD
ncbi:MAG TPA: hypothetical protein VJU59_11235 [Paraburkholderia sp.]|uniref:hypothetical protein n=1 Tax=Paraburkholderia sp. TaxID=1926495 RepID=UPI002B48FC69|nr:hypothetical protein [Paraburkholderia sp.]HKR40232.1 hypothetical protein [Paraburkholderia sp.]